MYHRYGVLDDMDDDEDEAGEHSGDFSSNHIYSADMLVAGMAGLGVNDSTDEMEQPAASAADAAAGSEGEAAGGQNLGNIGNWSLLAHPGEVCVCCGKGYVHRRCYVYTTVLLPTAVLVGLLWRAICLQIA